MKITDIEWNGEPAMLFHGEVSVEEVRLALKRMGRDPDSVTIGEVERWRRWPGQWNTWYERNKSPKLQGSFKARLVQ